MTRIPALLALLLVTSTLALVPAAEAARPSIDTVSPASGLSTGGTVITIKGKDFEPGAVVEIGTSGELDTIPAPWQYRATNVVVSGTKTELTATVPPHPPASSDDIIVRVRNPDGLEAEFAGLFAYTQAPAPDLTSVTPSVVASNGGTTVTLNGKNFDPKARFPEVRFGTPAAGVGYTHGVVLNVTATQIQVVAPAHEPGVVDVHVKFANAAEDSCSGCFQYSSSPRPTVFAISPTTGPRVGGTPVTITGTDFAPGTQVVFDNTASPGFTAGEYAAQVIFSSPTQITAMTPAQPTNPGTVTVRVVNPGALEADGTVAAPATNGHVSDEAITFSYTAGSLVPAVTSASPARSSVAGFSNVTLTGTNFHAGANQPPRVFVSPASDGTACPTAGQAEARVVSRSATSLVLEMPPMGAGKADVRVVNPDSGEVCKENLIEYVFPILIYELGETQGPTAGGTAAEPGSGVLTILGEGFVDDMTVTFLGPSDLVAPFPPTPFGLVGPITSTSLQVVPPPHKAEDVTVILTAPDGRSATYHKYRYVSSPAPTLEEVSGTPTSNGGELLTIEGTGFHFGEDPDGDGSIQARKPTVRIGSADVPAVDVIGDPGVVTSFQVKVPLLSATTAASTPKQDVTVTNPDGKSVKSDTSAATPDQAQYAKAPAPTVAATSPLSPMEGPTYGGTLVTLTGTNFATEGARPKVTVGGTLATVVGTPSSTQLQFLTPALTSLAAADNKDIAVENPDGQKITVEDNAKDFDYKATGAPAASSLSPANGPTVGGTVVTISGSNLGSTTRDSAGVACTGAPGGVPTPAEFDGTKIAGPLPVVEFAGKQAKVLCLVDGATDLLTVVTPVGGIGAAQVTVKAANGQSATVSQAFTYTDSSSPSLANTDGPVLIPATGGQTRTFAGSGFGPVTRDLDGRTCGQDGFDRSRLATPVPTVRFVAPGEANPPSTTDTCVRLVDGPDADSVVGDAVVLEVVAPPHAAGAVNVQVINPDGDAFSKTSLVRYLPLPPILTGPSPPAAVTLNGGTVTFPGVNLPIAPAPLPLLFVGAEDDEVIGLGEVLSTTREGSGDKGTLLARVPPSGSTGIKDAIAIDADGQSGTVNDALEYKLPTAPTFTSASVRTGTLNGNTTMTITGFGFAEGAIVTLRSGSGPDAESWTTDKVTVSNAGTQLSFRTPNFMQMPADSRRLTPFDVTILNPASVLDNSELACPVTPELLVQPAVPGAQTPPVLSNHCIVLPDLFGYSTVVGPRVTGIDPKTGAAGTLVTITGENFATGAKVHFGSAEATNVTVTSPTTITAKAPQGTGAVDVKVTVGANADTLSKAFTYTVTSSSSSSSTGPTTSRSSTSTTTGPGLPGGITPEDILEANERISVTVTRDGDANVIEWELPTSGLPGTVAGVQVWGSNSPYSLLQTCAASSSCFTASEFRHTGADARADTSYLVTMFYGTTQALGFYTQSTAPDTEVYEGTSSEDSGGPQGGDGGGSGGLPTWAIVLIVLGVLFLVVLVAILIARGRNRDARQQTAAQGYAWEETSTAEAQAASAEWDGAQAPEVHQARCPACATTFTATGSKPIVTVCPGCGKKGILR